MSDSEYLTPEDFLAWRKVNTAMLRDVENRNQRAVDDYVIKGVMLAIQGGLTLNQAGDAFLRNPGYGYRNGIHYTPGSVRRALRSIGWLPKIERAGGTAE
jgi:hypothetical protein